MALNVDGCWVDEVEGIKGIILDYFSKLYSDSSWEQPVLDGITFPYLTQSQITGLSASFSFDEVEEAIFSCDRNKAPGPDCFNFNFIKSCWEVVKVDVWGMFEELFSNARLPRGFTSYFLALISKISNPQGISDFRSISLLECLYKIFAKLLASRLRKIMNSIIASNQYAFILGSNIVDGVVIINEVVDYVKRTKKECLIFKVDFEKAYDTIDWNFPDYTIRRFGMSDKWRGWIKECIFRGELSILVNGSTTEEVKIHKGLK